MDGGACHRKPRGTASLRLEKSEGSVVEARLACDRVGNR